MPAPASVDFYYGPGVHNIGRNKLLPSGSQVYIAGGAVVVGSFRLQTPSSNVTIRGRGILTMCPWPHNYDNDVDWLRDHSPINAPRSTQTSDALFEGITIDNATGWHFALEVYNYQNQNNRYRNLKLVAFNANTDALWMDGNNITADDCFIFNHDDQITTHGSDGNRVTNSVFWGGTRGHFFAQYNFGGNTDFIIDNVDIIGQDGGPELIIVSPAGGGPKIADNITFRNIRIEEHPRLSAGSWDLNRFIFAPTAGKVTATNWLFENITLADKNVSEGDFSGNTAGRPLSMTFRNLKMGGSFVNSLAAGNMTATGVTSFTFSVDPAIAVTQAGRSIEDNTGRYRFGAVEVGATKTVVFTVANPGGQALSITGSPRVTVTGSGFSRTADVAATVSAGGTTTFSLTFTPTALGDYAGTVSISSNAIANNATFNFAITGTGASETLPPGSEVAYRETFGNTGTTTLATAGWQRYTAVAAGDNVSDTTSAATYGGISTAQGRPADLENIAAGGASPSVVNGFTFHQNAVRGLLFTEEFPLTRALATPTTLSWYSQISSVTGTNSQCAALRIGGQWYVSVPENNLSVIGSSATFKDNAAAFSVDLADASWRTLSASVGAPLVVGSSTVTLPPGDLQAFGVYFSLGSLTTFRMDTFELSALHINTLDTWRGQWFSATTLTNSALEASIWGNLADPDRDGLRNLLEYALGGNPNLAASAPVPTATMTANALQYRFVRLRSDVTYTVQASYNLVSWSDLSVNAGTLGQPVTVSDAMVAGQGQRFLRLKVANP